MSYFSGTGPYGSYGNLGLYGSLVSYGNLQLTESSPPQTFVEPLSLLEMSTYLNLPVSIATDLEKNTELNAMISAAREQAEIMQNRDLVRKQYDLAFDYWPTYRLELRAPLVSVDLLQYRDSTGAAIVLSENTDYAVDLHKQPGCVTPMYNKTWPTFTPWPSSALLLRFTSGYASDASFWADAGQRIRMGMKLLISGWWNGRIPFERGVTAANEYPFYVTSCLSSGALTRAR